MNRENFETIDAMASALSDILTSNSIKVVTDSSISLDKEPLEVKEPLGIIAFSLDEWRTKVGAKEVLACVLLDCNDSFLFSDIVLLEILKQHGIIPIESKANYGTYFLFQDLISQSFYTQRVADSDYYSDLAKKLNKLGFFEKKK